MYRHIYVPVDNSPHSNRAIDRAVAVGRAFTAKLTGCHVYAAKMHDYRFKQMEFTLPEEYLVESELARQRKIHDSLITMGLELVSDCYLQSMDELCRAAGLECDAQDDGRQAHHRDRQGHRGLRLRPGGARRAGDRPHQGQPDRLGGLARGPRGSRATPGSSSTCRKPTSRSATRSWSASTAARSRSAP